MPYDTLPGDELDQIEATRRVQPRLGPAPEQDRVSGDVPEEAETFNMLLHKQFEDHAVRLRERSHARRNAVQLKAAVLDREERAELSASDLLGRRQPQDEFQGDVNVRTLRQLLKMIDDNGFERYALALASFFP